VTHSRELSTSSWLDFAVDPFPEVFATQAAGVTSSKARIKLKDAFLRKRYSDRQLGCALPAFGQRPGDVGGGIGLCTFGGKVNSVAPDATAYPHRDSPISTSYSTGWARPEDEARSLIWLRNFYRDVFAEKRRRARAR